MKYLTLPAVLAVACAYFAISQSAHCRDAEDFLERPSSVASTSALRVYRVASSSQSLRVPMPPANVIVVNPSPVPPSVTAAHAAARRGTPLERARRSQEALIRAARSGTIRRLDFTGHGQGGGAGSSGLPSSNR